MIFRRRNEPQIADALSRALVTCQRYEGMITRYRELYERQLLLNELLQERADAQDKMIADLRSLAGLYAPIGTDAR